MVTARYTGTRILVTIGAAVVHVLVTIAFIVATVNTAIQRTVLMGFTHAANAVATTQARGRT